MYHIHVIWYKQLTYYLSKVSNYFLCEADVRMERFKFILVVDEMNIGLKLCNLYQGAGPHKIIYNLYNIIC